MGMALLARWSIAFYVQTGKRIDLYGVNAGELDSDDWGRYPQKRFFAGKNIYDN